jgi:hypothetical protein
MILSVQRNNLLILFRSEKMKHGQKAMTAVFLLVFLMAGCASTSTRLKEDDVTGIRKLAIITALQDDNLQILDRTHIKDQGYTGAQHGFLGALVAELITETAARAQVKGSLGGDPDLLRQAASDVPVGQIFDENFYKAFDIGCEILCRETVDSLRKEHQAKMAKAGTEDPPDAIAPYRELGVNRILKIEYTYALAAYGGGAKPSVVIHAKVSLANLDKERMARKTICSDSHHKKGYTIEEFKADGAEIFKEELAEATWALAYLVASEFGVELSQKERSYWRENE